MFSRSILAFLYNPITGGQIKISRYRETLLSNFLFKLERLQNKGLRIVCNRKRQNSQTNQFGELEILKIRNSYRYKIAKLMYSNFKKSLTLQFSCLFTNLLTIHGKPKRLRARNNFFVLKYSTQRSQTLIKFCV